jgi:hypothetical protein
MTYGENGSLLRAALIELMRYRRVQWQLYRREGQSRPTSQTAEERRQAGEQIRRYRQAILVWCRQVVTAADLQLHLDTTSTRSQGPVEHLHMWLEKAINASTSTLPSIDELAVSQSLPMVDLWRQAARAAAFEEHDFGAGFDSLSEPQRRTVLRDAAGITQALVVLDTRYEATPGWQPIQGRGRLDRAAQAVTAAGIEETSETTDLSVDQRGWQPPPALIEGPGLPGITGVIQAEHNMLVHLSRFPDVLSLKRIVDSQRILSHELSQRVRPGNPTLADGLEAREDTYARLQQALRNVGGKVGNGGPAASEAANAVSRLGHLSKDDALAPSQMSDLEKLFRHTDGRIATLIEQGASERLIFQRVLLPRLVDDSGHLVSPVRERYVPIKADVNEDLLQIVRQDLLTPPPSPFVPPESETSRTSLRQAISRKPDRRSAGPSI